MITKKEFLNILNDLGREVLERNLGSLVNDKRKKKHHDTGPCSDSTIPIHSAVVKKVFT